MVCHIVQCTSTFYPADSEIISGNYSGENIYAITSLGNVFTVEENSIRYVVSTGSTGTHMNIVQTATKGSIITGSENQIGIERTIRPYSAVHATDDYVFVLDKLDSTKVIDIPTFNGWYHYKGYLEKDNLTPNILRYTSRIYSDGGYMGHSNGYLVFYGDRSISNGIRSATIQSDRTDKWYNERRFHDRNFWETR